MNILLVEDNRADALIVQEAFKKCNASVHIRVASDGDEALDMLHRRNGFENTEVPELVLLDLNLPRVDGTTVLREMKEDAALRRIPVIVLTSSSAEIDINRSYENYASGYIIKPSGFEKMIHTISLIDQFWVQLVKRPSHIS